MDMLVSKVEEEADWTIHPLVVAKYPKDDKLGLFYGYYSLLVYEIQAVYITLFLRNRDMLTFYCCFTHLVSEIMNITLKQIFKQPRPTNGAPSGGLFEGKHGMPSQHCHCIAYLVTMVLLLTFRYYRHHISAGKKGLTFALCSVGLVLQILGRLYLKFHTLEQCLAGTALGVSSAITFYSLGLRYFMPYAQGICELYLMRQFSFRKDLITPPPSATSPCKSRNVSGSRESKLK